MKDYGLKYKAMFMTVYGGGLRVSELCNLRIQDINSENMRILVREGKESKYRYTLLSQVNSEILREYFKVYRPKHKENYTYNRFYKRRLYSDIKKYFLKRVHKI